MGGNLQDAANIPRATAPGFDSRNNLLNESIGKLAQIAEDLGNMLNDIDFTTDIDEKITEVAFEIVNDVLSNERPELN